MLPLLAFEFDPAKLEKLGLVGLLCVAVYILGRFAMKAIADKDAQIARAQEREKEREKERETWSEIIETMAANGRDMAAAMKELTVQVVALRTRFDEHTSRREGGG